MTPQLDFWAAGYADTPKAARGWISHPLCGVWLGALFCESGQANAHDVLHRKSQHKGTAEFAPTVIFQYFLYQTKGCSVAI